MDLTPLTTAGPAIGVHVICAVLALVLGPIALFRASRDGLHKLAGRVWVLAMLGAALSSFFIHTIRWIGPFSPIHLLSVVTLLGLAQGIRCLMRRDFVGHGRAMRALYLQAPVAAGIFTFLPGRRMNQTFFAAAPDLVFALALGAGCGIIALIWFAPGLRRAIRRA